MSELGAAVGRETLRRARLHDLDRMLDDLERLNLNDCREVPPSLAGRLGDYGIVANGHTPTQLIECVWSAQESWITPFEEPKVRRGRWWYRRMLAASGTMVLSGNATLRLPRPPRKQSASEVCPEGRLRARQRSRAWYRRNRKRARATQARWYVRNRDRYLTRQRVVQRARRAAKRAAVTPPP